MSGLRFLLQAAVFTAGVVALNLLVARLSAHTVPRQVLARARAGPPATDLFLGDSLVAAGVDEAAVRAAAPGRAPLNLGLGSSSPGEHALVYAAAGGHPARRVYYGFFDTQLTDPVAAGWSDLVGNRAMAYYADPDEAVRLYAADDPVLALQIRAAGRVPALVERTAIWARVERVRRRLGGLGLPPAGENRFGRAADFALLEPASGGEFTDRLGASLRAGTPLSRPVAALLDRARGRGARVILVEMPMPRAHRDRFLSGPEWDRYLASVARQAGPAALIRAADWVPDDGFADNLHLNPAGATVFSRRLAQTPVPD